MDITNHYYFSTQEDYIFNFQNNNFFTYFTTNIIKSFNTKPIARSPNDSYSLVIILEGKGIGLILIGSEVFGIFQGDKKIEEIGFVCVMSFILISEKVCVQQVVDMDKFFLSNLWKN
ncbi:hypothetical protein Glove_228g115 [Diversispora epigaea]|uniref:Uncharacterized protein n=1 Tax=Diversispora epigaea TaxID=1348612 RepID=A0A397IG97_9GLOM|nr:hypothetical protein Glove_228g115 [Diversispora epigaea]